jgi:hypothetical protein
VLVCDDHPFCQTIFPRLETVPVLESKPLHTQHVRSKHHRRHNNTSPSSHHRHPHSILSSKHDPGRPLEFIEIPCPSLLTTSQRYLLRGPVHQGRDTHLITAHRRQRARTSGGVVGTSDSATFIAAVILATEICWFRLDDFWVDAGRGRGYGEGCHGGEKEEDWTHVAL